MTIDLRYGMVREEVLPEGRLPDDPPKGGEKGRKIETMNITPYVAESISDYSYEELRTSAERQFRALADVTKSLQLSVKKTDEGTGGEITSLKEEVAKLSESILLMNTDMSTLAGRVTSLEERVTVLEEKPSGPDLTDRVVALEGTTGTLQTSLTSLEDRVKVLEDKHTEP